jgi:hypothetical protein
VTLQCSGFVALTTELAVARKALSEEKGARSAADRALAEEKAARQAADRSLLSSDEDNALLARDTFDKLSSKSSALDTSVIPEQQIKTRLTACEEKLTVANDKLKAALQARALIFDNDLFDSCQRYGASEESPTRS